MVASTMQIWEVIGGADKRGVMVRKGRDMSSPKEDDRLSTGAVVKQIALQDKRLQYELLVGSGPKQGWVSIEISNKPMLAPSSKQLPEIATGEQRPGEKEDPPVQPKAQTSAAKEVLAVASLPASRLTAGRRAGAWRDLAPTFGYAGSLDERAPYSRFDIREKVCRRVGGFLHGQVVRDAEGKEFTAVGVKCLDGLPTLFFQPEALGRPGVGSFPCASAAELKQMFTLVPGKTSKILREASLEDFNDLEDSDEELLPLCRQCRLPLGDFVYVDADRAGERHGECVAALVLQRMQEEEDERQQAEADRKAAARAEHDIGWRAERIPRNNAEHMRQLGYHRLPQGMCCLVLEEQKEEAETLVTVSETAEPAASVNLEYLSLALRCRLREGEEPAFSLDPTSTSDDPDQTLQQKRFEPAWLAGTSVGEVLFQSDYFLKELSMGEYDQPVIGMKSAFDFSEEEGHKTEWRAREWFVVKNAQICVSEDNVLIPRVEMAVEAREQFNGAEGIEDSLITRPDHPLVRYADTFSHNFDLIAERKSAVYHLRELAKASVLAKFLIEANISMKEAWFHLAGLPSPVDSLVIPQLWNDRCHSQVHVSDGRIVNAEAGVGSKKHSVYGGVEFGLDRFAISRPTLASGAMLARGASAQMSRVVGVTSVRQLGPPMAGVPLRAGIEAQAYLQGVDLNLSKFDLSTPMREGPEGPEAGWGCKAKNPCSGTAFWKSTAELGEKDQGLVHAIFNPFLSDRRTEGEQFVPPDTSFAHVQSLRRLVEEEAKARQARRAHFCSREFMVGNAGPLFPSSWTSSFEIMRGQVLQKVHASVSQEQYRPFTGPLPPALSNYSSRPPIFNKVTEDGTRFRIYRCGSLEVRTIQEHEGAESIGVIFAVGAPAPAASEGLGGAAVEDRERIVKVSEYVESAGWQGSDGQAVPRNFYVVAETANGSLLVTEMPHDGKPLLEEASREALQERNSSARVLRSVECRAARVTVRDLETCQLRGAIGSATGASLSDRKRYAQFAYNCGKGEAHRADSSSMIRTAKTWADLQQTLGLSSRQLAHYFS